MVKARRPPPAKLIVGFIFKNEGTFNKAKDLLKRRFGSIDFESPLLDFRHTDYYTLEFGADLKRKFLTFRKLIPPKDLARIKISTNKIEEKFSRNTRRLINIDPGILDLSKLVLASTKDYKHRIYLDKGIFAEVTLFYQDKSFRAWEWTYPDYKSAEYIDIFNQIRQLFAQQLKNTSHP